MGTARSRHSHTPQSGYSPALMPLAGAASGSCSARTNSGRGHGKRRDGSTELCYHWHSDWRVCVCACKCVCLSLKRTDWLTVNPPAVCMICPILHPATLCKQQFSGPEESHWQEVFISLYEQDGGERDKKKKTQIKNYLTPMLTAWKRASFMKATDCLQLIEVLQKSLSRLL